MRKALEFIYTGATLTSNHEEPDLLDLLTLLEVGGCTEVRVSDANTPSDFAICEIPSPSEKSATEDILTTSTKSFTCNVCGQILKTRTGLRMHLLTHEGTRGKVFTCDVCGKGNR